MLFLELSGFYVVCSRLDIDDMRVWMGFTDS